MAKLLFTDNEWDFDKLDKTWKVIDRIAKDKYGLDYYTPQIEVISAEQMLDSYCAHAMPVMYNHWSFGKAFAGLKEKYDRGHANLAYEVVINTNPSIAYLMETNSMVMQTLVMAHASCGHAAFFKNNYMFKEFTNADGILSYLKFAKYYVEDCEKRYGIDEVEDILDCAHAFMYNSVDKYPRTTKNKNYLAEQARLRTIVQEEQVSELDAITIKRSKQYKDKRKRSAFKGDLPEDNLLYFAEKYSLNMEDWQKELCRIVRNVAQYFYPQMLTKVMNEGFATFWHYTLMNDLYAEGYLSEGHYIEFIKSHTGVTYQPDYDSPHYSGLNPYVLGFRIFEDIRRICESPTDEDREWFPDLVDTDWVETIKDIAASYKDSSFVANFLSPKVCRDLKLFALLDEKNTEYRVSQIHAPEDVKALRRVLAKKYDFDESIPAIEVVSFSPGEGSLKLVNKTVERYKKYVDAPGLELYEKLVGCSVIYEE